MRSNIYKFFLLFNTKIIKLFIFIYIFILFVEDSDSDSSVDSSDIDSEPIRKRPFSLIDGMKNNDLISFPSDSSNQR